MDFIDLKTQYKKYKKEIDTAIQNVLDTSKYVLGPQVHEVERSLAEFVGVKHCVTASSGTDTLLMSMMTLNIDPGDEVITSPFTFISTVETISLLGAKPIFVDIDPDTFNLNIDQIEQVITPQTKAIMPVSLFGQMPDLDKLNIIAAKHGIPVIEDGAQSFGATLRGKRSCGITTIGSTSFFPAKPLGCYGDGGALFTNDDEIAETLRIIRVHGGLQRDHYIRLGMNGRFDTIQAAVIQAKLPHFLTELKARERIGKRYTELLENCCQPPKVAEGCTSNYAIYTIRIPNRDQVAAFLKEKGIPAPVYYPVPAYAQPVFKSLNVNKKNFPITEQVCDEVLSLPMHPWLTEEAQDFVVESVKEAAAVTV
ncbi:MAG: UDP-2-acetamido-2-deoxy-3-oxo-D-glucuronate aminotransferase [Chlamydiae bacterium]|nr:UDP-2-acetamido-2-deoxy-3-oxo-D-glucuronate aminotransferase [Chlamydiota bacterium]